MRAHPPRELLQSARAVIALTLVLWVPGVRAVEHGISPAGVAFASGGVGHEEVQDLRGRSGAYSFWLTTAAAGSGAYLAEAQVRITTHPGGQTVLEHTMAGPWLFAALPPGRYEVHAFLPASGQHPAQLRRGQTHIQPGEHRQMVLYFSTGDERGSDDRDWARPPGGASPAGPRR